MKSDEELKQTFKVFIDENEIINLAVLEVERTPEDNARVVELVKDALFKIFNENPQKSYSLFVDLSPIGKISRYGFSSQTRKISAQIASHKQLKKAAFVTLSIFVRAVVGFIITAARKSKNIKSFSNKKEALGWLKKKI